MGYLEKNFLLHKRGENGQLLPIDSFIEAFKTNVSMIPLSRGEVLDITEKLNKTIANKGNTKIIWEDVILKHMVEPKFTKEEIKELKLVKVNNIMVDAIDIFVDALYAISGISVNTKKEEEKLKKN